MPARTFELTSILGGALVDVTIPAGGPAFEIEYASFTGSPLCRVGVLVNGAPIDIVYAGMGGSHSWWANSGGALLPKKLNPGDRLQVTTSTGPCAMRIEWVPTNPTP